MNVYIKPRGIPTMGCRASFSTRQDDFGAPIREVRPYAPLNARAPTPKKPARPTPVPRSRDEQSVRPVSGRRADGAGELAPGPEPREARRQVQHDAAHRALDPDGELDQPFAQRGDLRVRTGGAAGAALELLEQQVGGQAQEDAELVGQKPGAAGPIHLQPVMPLP